MRIFCFQLPVSIALGLMASGMLQAQEPVVEEASLAQSVRTEWQLRLDAADDETREMLAELRRIEAETRRLDARSDALAPRLERRGERLDRREAALDTLPETRERLPEIERALITRLQAWVTRDLPFLKEERLARAAGFEAGSVDPDATAAERLDRLLAAWRRELDYGRELDAWRGTLGDGDTRRQVDFLRLGRVGLYYLTPDGREGSVWRAEADRWEALDEAGRAEVRHGLRIVRDQRAPELLTLPISRPLERADSDDTEASL
ncbi:DUF3450 domain-containing protein [Halomonas lysinitropha]|uniref:DUF3450 domain-containing protein n=1 Tax=Halomonas lysinitropha TaxID=2607506 RepID=A0A5K1I7Y5_9GAMM|nr:DUF3450 domain-containing protein [Halomonas lysinitropha]VVZ96253.1 hypothetical protein HALO32_02349 [Halomonas lysinitropha]